MAMEIVSASLNTTFPEVNEMVANRDKKALIRMCNQQLDFGATRIGFNCATRLTSEVDDMLWITRTLQDVLALGTEHRMNIPGTTIGNWGFSFQFDMWWDGFSDGLKYTSELFGRNQKPAPKTEEIEETASEEQA